MAYTPTPLYKFDNKTGSIEFVTLTGAGNFLATEDGTPILLKGFSYNDLFINVT